MELFKLEKIEKNSYMSGIITSMLTILICLIAMCGSAYAYFTTTLTSGSNTIQAAYFDLDVNFEAVGEELGLKIDQKSDYIYELSYNPKLGQIEVIEDIETTEVAEESEVTDVTQDLSMQDSRYATFKITLSNKGTASTGFAEVEVIVGAESKKGFTHQIGANLNDRGEEDPKDTRELEFKVPAGCTVVVKFVPQWGSYVGGAYIDEEVINIEAIFSVAPLIEEVVEEHEEETLQETAPPEETIEEIPEDQEDDAQTEENPEEEVSPEGELQEDEPTEDVPVTEETPTESIEQLEQSETVSESEALAEVEELINTEQTEE